MFQSSSSPYTYHILICPCSIRPQLQLLLPPILPCHLLPRTAPYASFPGATKLSTKTLMAQSIHIVASLMPAVGKPWALCVSGIVSDGKERRGSKLCLLHFQLRRPAMMIVVSWKAAPDPGGRRAQGSTTTAARTMPSRGRASCSPPAARWTHS